MKLIEFQHDRYRGGSTPVFVNPEEVSSVTSARNDFGEAPNDRNESVIIMKDGTRHTVVESERTVVRKLTEMAP